MGKIPKEIVDKIELRNALNEEIREWCKKNIDINGMDIKSADITDKHIGEEQGTDDCKEWCDQVHQEEDWCVGDYFWETEYEGKKYLHMPFFKLRR